VKTCIACGFEKPKTSKYFYYRNKARGWLSSWCIDCQKKKRKETSVQELKTQKIRRHRIKRFCKICKETIVPIRKQICVSCMKLKTRKQKRLDKCLYRSRLRKATPIWADKSEIRRIYGECPSGMVVDHIIPIRGEFICGFHVPENLQYLTNMENMRKSNHYSLTDGGRK